MLPVSTAEAFQHCPLLTQSGVLIILATGFPFLFVKSFVSDGYFGEGRGGEKALTFLFLMNLLYHFRYEVSLNGARCP